MRVDRAGVFLAGCVTDEDKALLARLCNETWPGAKTFTGSDRESGMAAALGNGDGIVVNAGSGSSVTGRRDGRLERRADGATSSAMPAALIFWLCRRFA